MKTTKTHTDPFFTEFLKTAAPKEIPRIKRWFKLVRKLGDRAPTLTYQAR